MLDFKIGDSVFHKSNSRVKWIVERIDNNEAYCSTVVKDTLEQKKEVFSLTSIDKCADPTIMVSKPTRSSHF